MPRTYISSDKKHAIIERAEGRCEYRMSRADYATESFAIEHIIPVSRGGTSEPENLALACSGCNGHKYIKLEAVDPIEGIMVPLFNPRQQNWHEHFGWSDDYIYIIGLTAVGRATIEALKMNRVGLVNMRRVLYLTGKHPSG